MKKIIICVLALMTCVLPLCSCVSEEEQNAIDLYNKYEDVIKALEDKNYEEAVKEIFQIYQDDQNGENDDDDNDDGTETGNDAEQVDPAVEAFKAEFIGEWIYYDYDSETNITFTVREDGTCSFGGKDYTWTYDDDITENYGKINVTDGRDGEYDPYYISYDINSDTKEVRASIYEREDKYIATSITGSSAYNLNNYTVVELTKDNIFDYFEYVEIEKFGENAFGEVTYLGIYDYLALKDEYQNGIRTGISSNVAIEVTRNYCYRTITIDAEARTYELGDVEYTYDPDTSIKTAGNYLYGENDESYYSFDLGGGSCSVPGGNIYFCDDYVIERTTGTMYIYNK